MSRVQRGYQVTGRVQGVGFRWFAQAKGKELGLCGTVRNLGDGSVELHIAGDSERVEEMEAWLRDGPSSSRVDELKPIPSKDRLPVSFEIVF
jgi:acylphosphatase